MNGDVFLTNGFHATGAVSLPGAQIGGQLACEGGRFDGDLSLQEARTGSLFMWSLTRAPDVIDLVGASAAMLADARSAWPAAGGLRIDRFDFVVIAPTSPLSAKERLEWLRRQAEDRVAGSDLHAYEQLGVMYDRSGRPDDARDIRVARFRLIRGRLPWWSTARWWD